MSVKVKVASDLNTMPEECIVPVKQADNPSVGTVKLRVRSCDATPMTSAPVKITINDCLMCSGCVTSAEEVFFRELNVSALEHAIVSGPKAGHPIVLSLSPSAILSLYTVLLDNSKYEAASIDFLFKCIEQALRTRAATLLGCSYDDAPPVNVISELQSQEQSVLMNLRRISSLLEAGGNYSNIAIITHCPAVRLFIMKRNHDLVPYILSTASPMELFGAAHCNNGPVPLIISIQPCQDRKLEQFRGAKVDICLTAQELYSFIQGSFQNVLTKNPNSSYSPSPISFWQYALGPLLTLYLCAKGWISNATASSFIVPCQDGLDLHWTKLGNELFSCTINLEPGLCAYNQVIVYKSAGYHNLQNLVRRIHAMCPHSNALYIFDLHACPNSCFGGACIAGDDVHPISMVAMESYKAACASDRMTLLHILEMDAGSYLLMSLLHAVNAADPQETVIRVDGEVVSPDEIARRKGISSAVRVQDLTW